jgi:hypothetical protein
VQPAFFSVKQLSGVAQHRLQGVTVTHSAQLFSNAGRGWMHECRPVDPEKSPEAIVFW